MQTNTNGADWQHGYMNAGTWQAGWTSTVAHLVVGMARRHGNARTAMVRGTCGQNFNPGARIDPENVRAGYTLCSACRHPSPAKVAKVRRLCEKCGETNQSSKSPLCSPCREIASWGRS